MKKGACFREIRLHQLALNLTILLLFLSITIASPFSHSSKISQRLFNMPLLFERNEGQHDATTRFLARGPGHVIHLTQNGLVLGLTAADSALPSDPKRQDWLSINLLGSPPSVEMIGLDQCVARTHYFIGTRSTGWHHDIATFSRVHCRNIYPSIDLVYYGNDRQLEFDFVIQPGADPSLIRMSFMGHRALRVLQDGRLFIDMPHGVVSLQPPQVYQMSGDKRLLIPSHYLLKPDDQVCVQVERYDEAQSLIIDPVLAYATYWGGAAGWDELTDMALDANGCVYLTGFTSSTEFPHINPFQGQIKKMENSTLTPEDIFISKLDLVSGEVIYSTFLGGKESDRANAIAVDAAGCAYVVGETESGGPKTPPDQQFPTMRAFQDSSYNYGGPTAFILKLSTDGGTLLYSTYFGDRSNVRANDVAVDAYGKACMLGSYYPDYGAGPPFPIRNAFQPNDALSFDYFVAKFNPGLSGDASLIYSSFLGGTGMDGGETPSGAIAVDAAGNAYVTGYTTSTNFPTKNAIQAGLKGEEDAFVCKISADGSNLLYSTYLGGSGNDEGYDLQVDADDCAYLVGEASDGFPKTEGTFSPPWSNSFLAKIAADGKSLLFSSAALSTIYGSKIALDKNRQPYVFGEQFRTSKTGSSVDLVLTKFTANASDTLYTFYLGGSSMDKAKGMATDGQGLVFLACQSQSADLPIESPMQAQLKGQNDAYVAVVAEEDIMVNSSGDDEDANLQDGVCDTGKKIERNGIQECECTLRAAIQTANAAKVERAISIAFDIPGDEVPVIRPAAGLPALRHSMTLNGKRQPKSSLVHIDGSNAGEISGLRIEQGVCDVRGLWISHFYNCGVLISGTANVTLAGNIIGLDRNKTDFMLNQYGGVYIHSHTGSAEIGNFDKKNQNWIGGGIVCVGAGKASVGMNVLRMPESMMPNGSMSIPIDWRASKDPADGTAGPTTEFQCPVKIIKMDTKHVEGFSRKTNETVMLYTVSLMGSGRMRYYARDVEAFAFGKTDENGYFSIPVTLAPATLVTAAMVPLTDESAEFTQLRRPVVFIPGSGGSWLEAEDGTNLWLPTSLTDYGKDVAINRLAMKEDGKTGQEPVAANTILESYAGFDLPYGPFLEYFQNRGYPGNIGNSNPAAIDLWRFPYDWRMSSEQLSVNLFQFIEQIIRSPVAAKTAMVDIVAHSYGGIVAAHLLEMRHQTMARDYSIGSLVTIGTPFLGTPQTAAAHIQGHLFGADLSLHWSPNWSRITESMRNWPLAYFLLPSPQYWDAVNMDQIGDHYLADLKGIPLSNYYATLDFFSREKEDAAGAPWGLARNWKVWNEEENVHDSRIDNVWSAGLGRHHHLFRLVGQVPNRTVVAWREAPGPEIKGASTRRQFNDTDRHVTFRERLQPVFGPGDGTVTLGSATLGRAGKTDLSGVGFNKWVEEFEYYPCDHMGLASPDCINESGLCIIDRIISILESSHKVPPKAALQKQNSQPLIQDENREILYVSSSAPILVAVEDDQGRRSGPVSTDSLGRIQYQVPDISYYASSYGASASLPPNRTYKARIESPSAAATVQIIRQQVNADSRKTILFNEYDLAPKGRLLFAFSAAGTSEEAIIDVDANGDEQFEGHLLPSAQLTSTSAEPALPNPYPRAFYFQTNVNNTIERSQTLTLPQVGEQPWNWQISSNAEWLQIDKKEGQTPATVALQINKSSLTAGAYHDTLKMTITYSAFHQNLLIPVALDLFDQNRPFVVSLPDTTATPDSELLLMILLDEVYGNAIHSLAVTLAFNSSVLEFIAATNRGMLTQLWGELQVTTPTAGEVRVELQGTTPLTADGAILGVRFRIRGKPGDSTHVGFKECRLNDGMHSVIMEDGLIQVSSPAGVADFSSQLITARLDPCVPNPFNMSTTIRYEVPTRTISQQVRLDIFDIRGRHVRRLIDAPQNPGSYQLHWDGRNQEGEAVSSGIFIICLRINEWMQTTRVVLIK